MKRQTLGPDTAPGLFRGQILFDTPTLQGYRFPCYEVTGRRSGSRLCVMAGVHVNEVSSIEAAIRLQSCFLPETVAGSVSIIPVVNQPAVRDYTQYACPLDGKNINFSFPGRPDGSFTDALCHALLFEWAEQAEIYVDLHGGDLRERVARFVMFQRTGDPKRDDHREALARCFDADFVVSLDPEHLTAPGRAITALARLGRDGVMAEAGNNGIIDPVSVDYHVDGVLNIARMLGMIEGPLLPASRDQILCDRYLWLACPADGFFYPKVHPGDYVARDQRLGVVRDVFGTMQAELVAPENGYILWGMTHPVLYAGDTAFGLACPVHR